MKCKITVLLCILLMISLIACTIKDGSFDETSPSTSENTSPANDTSSTQNDMQNTPALSSLALGDSVEIPDMQIPLPKTGSVYTDYSVYTPYTYKNDEIYTRLSTDFLPELIPLDSYGTIVPYVGEFFMQTDYDDFVMYGLCTTDGMIITDPVYRYIYQPDGYNDSYGFISQQFPVYMLERLMAENENMYIYNNSISAVRTVPDIAVCAIDGSWVTEYYDEVRFFNKIMLLYRENDADVFDYNGNFLYNTQDLHVDIQWRNDPSFKWAEDARHYSDGYFFLENWVGVGEYGRSKGCAFISDLTGEVYIIPYEDAHAFSDGRAAVLHEGLWGYINTNMELVIDFHFTDAGRFVGGFAKCRLPNNEYVLITKDGAITAQADNYWGVSNPAENILYDTPDPEFIYDSRDSAVRDRNGKILFTYEGNLNYLEHANIFTLSRYENYDHDNYFPMKFELIDTKGKCVFRKNVISQWDDD